MDKIAAGLEADGILTGAGKTKWHTSANVKKRAYSCNHCFSLIIICGDCGEMFRRIHWEQSRLQIYRLALQQDLLKKANNKEAYDEIADEIFRLRELKQQAAVDTVTRDEQIGHITEHQDFIRSQPAELTEFDEVLVKRWVQKITVWPDRYRIELKSGLSVDIEG